MCCSSSIRWKNHRARPGQAYCPTDIEHLANILTHGLVIPVTFFCCGWLLHLSHDPVKLQVAVLYGSALASLFCVSCMHHVISATGWLPSWRNFFHIGDRTVIYFFIAAAYTPWLVLRDFDHNAGMVSFFAVWTAAVCGSLYQYKFHEQYKLVEVILYISVGVLPSICVPFMFESTGVWELGAGGALYILGVAFFKLDGVLPLAHAIWHCFVTAASALHFYAISRYLYHSDPLTNLNLLSLAKVEL